MVFSHCGCSKEKWKVWDLHQLPQAQCNNQKNMYSLPFMKVLEAYLVLNGFYSYLYVKIALKD